MEILTRTYRPHGNCEPPSKVPNLVSAVGQKEIIKSDVSWDELFMRQVYLIASKSKDPRTKIGSVLVKNGHVIATGYNGFPAGVIDYSDRYHDRTCKYEFVCHSETNAILQCAKLGIAAQGSALYTQGIPCSSCAKNCINAGIATIILHKQWPNLTHSPMWVESVKISNIMFDEAGINICWLDKRLNLCGFLDGKLIEV